MKITGLITEYNPFHFGHEYHLKKARELTGADAVIAVMSGDFTQRGLPAFTDKYARAKMALKSGVDAVIELPALYSLSSAEGFAKGAVDILAGLGADTIVYGCEDETADLKGIADICLNEPAEYKAVLNQQLKAGASFPAARLKALTSVYGDKAECIASPNAILAVEYEKAILKGGYDIKTIAINRQGDSFYKSGENIRAALLGGSEDIKMLLPQASIEEIAYAMEPDDFSGFLNYKLLTIDKEALTKYLDVTEDIAARIYKHRGKGLSFSELTKQASSKNYTASRIRRCLMHILLDITSCDAPIYARVLGARKDSDVLAELKSKSSIPFITKPADAPADILHAIEQNNKATLIYNQAVYDKYGIKLSDDFHAGFIAL